MKTKNILAGLSLLLVAACASIGAPDGGIYDEIPPKVVSTTPRDLSTGNTKQKMEILFDEYIKIENASEKVIVSPPQIEPANIRADGKRVKITLYDTLQANTTYTIDFSDAITDNNEGNPMGHYTYSFSTGEAIDTMQVSGTVLNAEDLEPIKGILVGLYPADSTFTDSTFTTVPLSRISRTNGSGQFVIKGVKPGTYRAFALEDKDGNYFYSQKSERLSFMRDSFVVYSKPDIRMDTIWRDSTRYDSIRVVPYTHYFPDDLVLNAFLVGGQDQHLLKTERPEPDFMKLYFTAPADSLPVVRGLNFDEKCLVVEPSLKNDTITYWITDTAFTHREDTIKFEITFLETDSLGMLSPHTETLELSPKTTWAKIQKEKQKLIDEWQKAREKRAKKAKEALPPEDNPYLKTPLEISVKPAGTLDPNQNPRFTAKEPILQADTTRMHLYLKKDSNWIPEPFLFLPEADPKSYTLYAEWEQKETYRFMVDSAAIVGVMGNVSNPIKNEFRIKTEDEYGSIFVHVIHPEAEHIIVQLMNKSDKPQMTLHADKDGRADFFFVRPAEYYLRCFVDRNENGVWDTGSYEEKTDPEEVYYFPGRLVAKAKWEIEQDWEPLRIDRIRQKPKDITKQKPDKEKQKKNRNAEREMKKRK